MRLLNSIKSKNILVIGDAMLDTYYMGEIKRISPEAPVPVFRKRNERSVLGGAANVASNLAAAEQNVFIMTMLGKDKAGERVEELLRKQGIHTELSIRLDRDTTEKVRFLAANHQQVLRLDVEDTGEIDMTDTGRMLGALEKNISCIDFILISDYQKGLLNDEFIRKILQMAREKEIPAIVDVKAAKPDKYKGAYLIKPNLKELRELTRMPAADDKEIIEASERLRNLCDCKYVLTTCGARGMVLIGDGKPYFIKAAEQEVFDVTGAGDTTIAYLSACMANGFSMRESVDIANCAAGIQVSKAGTSVVYWNEVRERLSVQTEGFAYKLLGNGALESFRKNNINKKVVFTNGCFDVLHIGHIRYLQEAAKLGDILIVGLNSDASVKRLKGAERPINTEMDRAELICALGFVDYVAIFEEDTPYELIGKIQPDILVKGMDYRHEEIIGTDIVEGRGGKVILIPLVDGKSTTNIVQKIKKGLVGER